jgi:hypothetical protein
MVFLLFFQGEINCQKGVGQHTPGSLKKLLGGKRKARGFFESSKRVLVRLEEFPGMLKRSDFRPDSLKHVFQR